MVDMADSGPRSLSSGGGSLGTVPIASFSASASSVYPKSSELVTTGDLRLLEINPTRPELSSITIADVTVDAIDGTLGNQSSVKGKPPNERAKALFIVLIASTTRYSFLEGVVKVLMEHQLSQIAQLIPDRQDPKLVPFVKERSGIKDSKTQQNFLRSLFEFVSFYKDKGLSHIDVNPHNMCCSRQGDRVRVIEFSSQKHSNPDSLESHTLPYVAPEVMRRAPMPTSISWSIACCFIFFVTGDHPWAHLALNDKQLVDKIAGTPDGIQVTISLLETKHNLNKDLIRIIRKLLQPDHRDRMACTFTESNKEPLLKVTIAIVGNSQASNTDSKQSLEILKRILFDIILKKEYTPYDFWVQLKRFKGVPTNLVNDDGYNILHLAVDKGRLSLLQPIIHRGWWEILSKQVVPTTSQADHRGKTALEIAEMKRTRKPQEEVKAFTKLEASLTALMRAVRSGDTTRAMQLAGKDVNDLFLNDENGGNALYWAGVSNDPGIFQHLLDKGVEAAAMRTKKSETLLHIIAAVGSHHVVGPLVKFYKKNNFPLPLNAEDMNHKTPQDRFAENGDVDMCKAFIEHGLAIAQTVPVLASYAGRKNLLVYVIDEHKMSIDSIDVYSRTALHRAIEGGRLDIAKYLLERSPNVTLRTSSRRNILHLVGENGDKEIAELLLNRLDDTLLKNLLDEQDRYNGVDLCFLIRGRDHGRDAWHYVEVPRFRVPVFLKKTKSGNVDVAAYGTVIKSGWGINPDTECVAEIEDMFKQRRLDQKAPSDMTPLHVAIYKGHSEVAKMFLQKGADVNLKDRFGLTPLMLAAAKGNIELLQLLENKGAKINETNEENKTAKDIADENENDQIVHYISGRDYYSMAESFANSNVEDMKKKLTRSELERIRSEGIDVRDYLINTLRGFTTEVNKFLVDIGSGPVHQPTD